MNSNIYNQWSNILNSNGISGSNWLSSNSIYNNGTNGNQFESILPITMKIAAQTIGLDFVSVQPMSAPTMNMFYTDYKHQPHLTKEARKEKLKRVNAEWRKHKIDDIIDEKPDE